MKKLLLLVAIASPLALNAMQKAKIYDAAPIQQRFKSPATGRILAVTRVDVVEPNDTRRLETFIKNHNLGKSRVRGITVGDKFLLISSDLSKAELQNILNEFH